MSAQRSLGIWQRAFGIVLMAAVFFATAWNSGVWAAPRLISRDQARHLGLERSWFGQVRLDRARNRVERAVLARDRLTVLTSAGVVHEFNANTGETLWIAPIGNPNYPSLGPAAGEQHVALLNGSTLYVLDRTDGRPVIVQRVGGAPGASPALAKQHVFVPLMNGKIEGYPLGEQTNSPWYYQSYGRALVPPFATPQSVVWSTDTGHVYVADSQKLDVLFRMETGSDIVAPAAYHKPYIYIAAMSGELFALHELTGARRWKYAAGFFVTRAPAAVGERVFITSDEPSLHCIDAATGHGLWDAPNITQFAAASRNRIYAIDELGALVVLDAASGAPLERMPTEGTMALVNDQTDRIYLVSNDGVVQCLYEIGAKEPLYHNPPEAEPTPSDETTEMATDGTTPSAEPGAEAPPATENPFGGFDEADPEMDADDAAAEEGAFGVDDENPFGE